MTEEAYSRGYSMGYGDGRADGYTQGYGDAVLDFEPRLAKYWSELAMLNARIDYLEKLTGGDSHECN